MRGGTVGLTVACRPASEQLGGKDLLRAAAVELRDPRLGAAAIFASASASGERRVLAKRVVRSPDGRQEEGRLLGRLGRLFGLVTLLDQVNVQQRLPAALGHEAQRHHVPAELVDHGHRHGIVLLIGVW